MLCKIKRSIFFNNNSFYSYGILPLQSLFVSIGSFNVLMQSMINAVSEGIDCMDSYTEARLVKKVFRSELECAPACVLHLFMYFTELIDSWVYTGHHVMLPLRSSLSVGARLQLEGSDYDKC